MHRGANVLPRRSNNRSESENSIGDNMATSRVAITPMKVARIPKPGADFEIVESEIPKPGVGQVRVKVQACGVCHSDALTKEGQWPGIQYPRVPGHEVVGIIDELGAGVSEWKKGQRAGVGWHGGQDGTCPACRRGDFRNCRNLKVPGISYDGGYQQYMLAPTEALVAIPESLSAAEAAPLLCAGITTFNALRHSGAMPGDLVAVVGVGGHGSPRNSIREQVRLQGRGYRTGVRECRSRQETRSEGVHRQQIDERSRGIAEIGWRTGNSGDSPEFQIDVRADRWSGPERQAHGGRYNIRPH